MNSITIGLWNANGLQATSINDVLNNCTFLSMLFITETWLLPPTRLPTNWKQHHIYGTPVAGGYRGSMGICALISPSCRIPIIQEPVHNRYSIGFKIGDLHIRCLYLPPSLDDEEALTIIQSIPLTRNTIICGDLNARLGNLTGDHDSNLRGGLLKRWIQEQDLIVQNGLLVPGIPTYLSFRNNREISSIIDLIITNFEPQQASMHIQTELSLGSDHKLLSFSFTHSQEFNQETQPPPRKLWHLSRLQEEPSRDLYIHQFKNNSQDLLGRLREIAENPPPQQPPIDDLSTELTEYIYQSLTSSIGNRQHRPKEWKWFWTPQLEEAAKLRDRLYRRWRRAVGLDKVEWWERHQQAHAEFRTAVKESRRQAWRNHCDAMARDPMKAASKVKQLRRRKMQSHTFTHENGPQAAAEHMCEHLSQVYSGELLPSDRPIPDMALQHPIPLDECLHESRPFQEESIQANIQLLPNRKAPGIDQIKAEMLKPIARPLSQILHYLFTICWQWSSTPASWRHAQVCPIFKKGDHTQPSNYRPISLTSVLRKLLEMCLANMLHTFSPPIDQAQGGFRPRRSPLDQVVCLHDMMTEYYRNHRRYPTVAFLHIKAAYDTVDRNVIWSELTTSNTPKALLLLLSNLFDHVTINVLLQNHTSASFQPTTGVLQGSVLSPHLYSIYINSLPKLLREAATPQTLTVGTEIMPINTLLFADDVAIIGTHEEVQHMLNLAADHSLKLGYRWSPMKCAISNPPGHYNLILYDQALPTTEEFTYLGVPFRKQGMSASALIHNRTNGAIASMSVLHALGASRTGFELRLSARLYAQFIRPKFEYGLAISQLLKKDILALEKIQDRCLRMIVGGHKTAFMFALKHICHIPPMEHRYNVLVTKFCLRLQQLPADCLLPALTASVQSSHVHQLRSNAVFESIPAPLTTPLQQYLEGAWQQIMERIRNQPNRILLNACRPTIGLDPILSLPMTRIQRSRMIRWRIGWLPGKPVDCPCGSDHTSRRHMTSCERIPQQLWHHLPLSTTGSNRIDLALNSLPGTTTTPCPFWIDLQKILRHIETLRNPEVVYPSEPTPEPLRHDP